MRNGRDRLQILPNFGGRDRVGRIGRNASPSAMNKTAGATTGLTALGQRSIGGGTTHSFNGRIDEVRIWNRVRSNQEIRVNAKRRLKVQESNLIEYWHFEGYNLIGKTSASGFIHGQNGDQVGTEKAPIDPKLGKLKDNGGSTWTRALLVGSPALNAANLFDRPQTDQRGVDRGRRPDIGAYEQA